MKSFINFLWSGFGTGNTAARAIGIAILAVLGIFIVAYYLIRWIVRLFQKKEQ